VVNLIVTILSIALVAVGAIAGLFYVGGALQDDQPKIWANSAISQSQQIIAAATLYSNSNNGKGLDSVGFGGLVSQNYLSTWPEFVMLPPSPVNSSSSPTTVTNGLNDDSLVESCPALNGYRGEMIRWGCMTTGGQNTISLYLSLNDPYNGTCLNGFNTGHGYGFEDTRYNSHPFVQLAKALNAALGTVPASTTLSPSGLPYFPSSYSTPTCNQYQLGNVGIVADSSGKIINYCYLTGFSGNTQISGIECPFLQ